MSVTEEHPDILQNIEFGIMQVFKKHPELRDTQVDRAVDALVEYYRALAREHEPKAHRLRNPEAEIFDAVRNICEMHPETVAPDVLVSCLRRIKRSIAKWSKQAGPQGYLQFVQQFIG